MAKKVLVPTDGSSAALDAARYAVKVAKKMGYEMVGLAVINKHKLESLASSFTGEMGWLSVQQRFMEESRKDAMENLNQIKEICKKKGVTCKTEIREGFPHEEIIRYVNENEDVIVVVMGASGKDFVYRKLLGGVTEKVIQEVSRKLPCPVVVTPCQERVPNIRLDF